MSDPHAALRHVAESVGLTVRRGLRGFSADGTVDGIRVHVRAGRTPVVVGRLADDAPLTMQHQRSQRIRIFTGDGDFDFEINTRGPEARLRACLDQEARLAVADALMERAATIARGRITLPIPIPADPASVRQTLDRVVRLARLLSRSGDAALAKIALEDQVCAALGALACVADDARRAALVEQVHQRSDADGFNELGSIAAVAPLRIGLGALMVATQRGAGGPAIFGEALKNVDPDIRQTAVAALARDPAGIDVLRGAAENPQLSEFARRDVRAAVEAWHARRGIAGGEVSLNAVADAGGLAIDDGGLE